MQSLDTWLRALGLERYAEQFAAHEIDLRSITLLADGDLREMGLPLGPRKLLLKAIAELASDPLPIGSPPQQAERRQLTVLFCDVVDWTALSQQLDLELLREITRAYQTAAAEVIHRYDGHVAQYLGDGVLAYFGYPRAHEDDAERAVRAALGTLTALQALNATWSRSYGVEVSVRLGLHTGIVVVGEIGDAAGRELLALGEAPNVAARLQALAEPNTVVLSEQTRRIAQAGFEYVSMGMQHIKGMPAPLRVWRALGQSVSVSRFDAATRSGLTPMVNREQEIGLLIDRWQHARVGEGRAVLISGEAGVGKSRLLRALRERLEPDLKTQVRFQCSPYHANTAFYPIIAGLQLAFGLSTEEPSEAKLDKIESFVAGRYHRPLEDVRLIASVLSVEADERHGALNMTPQRRKDAAVRALIELLEAVARAHPALIVFEDVHWADPTTMEVLDRLIRRVKRMPVLLLVAQRSAYRSDWLALPHVTGLALERLGRAHCAAMIEQLTRGKDLPADLLERVLSHADGVPLFVEELTKSLLESSTLRESARAYEYTGAANALPIPATLRDSLIARLERSPGAKLVAQTGAAIGREFGYTTLAAAAELPEEELQRALSQLAGAGLLFAREGGHKALYVFKHALVRDAAYDSMLKETKRVLHAKIARALEREGGQELARADVLAHHFSEAGLHARALEYWRRAGEEAAARSANVEAVHHFRKALELLGAMPSELERERQALEVHVRLGPVLVAAKGYGAREVEQTYTEAQRLLERVGASPKTFPIIRGQFQLLLVQARYEAAHRTAGLLLALAKEKKDAGALVDADLCAGLVALYRGDFESAHRHLAVGAEHYQPKQHRLHSLDVGVDLGVGCLAYDARVLWLLGYPDQAVARAEQAVALAQSAPVSLTRAQAMGMLAILHQARRDEHAAAHWLQQTLDFSVEHGHAYWIAFAGIIQGWQRALQGEAAGVQQMHDSLAAYRATGARLGESWFGLMLAEAYQQQGDLPHAFAEIERALEHVRQSDEQYCTAELHRTHGELLLQRAGADAAAQAEACFTRALELARTQGAKSWELRAAVSMAKLLLRSQRAQAARALLTPLLAWFKEGFDTADYRHAQRLLTTDLNAAV